MDLRTALSAAMLLLAAFNACEAQLRVVSWNTATANSSPGFSGRETDFNRLLDFVGRESINGISKPIDILALQEQTSNNSTLADFAAELNTITGTSDYVAWSEVPFNSDGFQTGFVYNSASVTPILEDWFRTDVARSTSRVRFRPAGYGADADVWVYSSHYIAGTTNGDLNRRRDMAFDIRISGSSGDTNSGSSGVSFGSDSIGISNANIIYAGDFNQKTSTEEASNDPFSWISNPYEILKLNTELGTSGDGQAVDPINSPGSWFNNSSFASIHTQSPYNASFGLGLTTGGMDDRFDFQMTTTDLNDGEGVDYIGSTNPDTPLADHSYRTFGNNGTTFNSAANSTGNTGLDWIITNGETLPGLNSTQTRDAVRNSLARASDHSPLVADYQVPAVLDVMSDSIPSQLNLGQAFDLNVAISNAADVVATLGADELDYLLSVSGDLTGGASGVEAALGGGDVVPVTFDTSATGAKTGTITVTTSSFAATNSTVQIPVSYTVVGGILGDLDLDSDVDADDIDTLRANTGSSDPFYDLNNDSVVDFVLTPAGGIASDSDEIVRSILDTEYGDANLDKKVDFLDVSALSGGFGGSGGWAAGNFNADGVIDFLDVSALSGSFGFDNSSPSAASVPEPAGIVSLMIGLMCLSRRRSVRR